MMWMCLNTLEPHYSGATVKWDSLLFARKAVKSACDSSFFFTL
jgi:hypothetical protein